MGAKRIIMLLFVGIMLLCSCGKKEVKQEASRTAVAENNNGAFLISENEDMIQNPEVESARVEGEMITVIIPDVNLTGFTEVKAQSVSPEKIDAIIRCIKANNVITADIKTPSVSVKKEKAVVDFQDDFGDFIKNMGSTGEYYIMGSIVNSVIKNYGVEKVKVTCSGKDIETGHNIYDGYEKEYKKR